MIPFADLIEAPVRQASALAETEHRPWPLPDDAWVMGQTWDDLLFVHWPVEPSQLRGRVPGALGLDERDGSAWLGITPFEIRDLRVRGTFPLPRVSRFPELNVRTYVTHDEKPGIWFFSLDTSSRLAVEVARRLYRLPYFQARMTLECRAGRIAIESVRDETKAFSASYRPVGEHQAPQRGSREHFLTDRYCLYAEHGGRLYRAEIHHRPWPLQPAEASIDLNSMPPDGVTLDGDPLLHFSRRQDVVLWPLQEVGGTTS
jgi:uncharacterized protein YqjF (DUF2071 family)